MSAESSPAPELVAVDPRHSVFGALGDLELEFEKAEVETMKYQIKQTAPLYTRRNDLTSSIPTFWPTVLDSVPDFDQHVAPQDVEPISAITAVNVVRPDAAREPRDFIVEISFDPARNEWFEEETLRKRFWHRSERGDGLVSEPVEITWREGKDLSGGETGRVCAAWKDRKNAAAGGDKGKGKGKASANGGQKKGKKALEERLAGGQPSFFTWFAWVGKGAWIDDEEEAEEEDDEEGENEDLFNHGDELALTIADDVYPNAIKYFLESLNADSDEVDSDMSVSELDDEDDEGEEDSDDEDGVLHVIGGEEEDDSEDDGIGGSSSARVKRHDITLSDDEEEDEGSSRRKRVKK
ncbi:hypothetical protein DRE_00379 [Drechslerella stenobrocha 248]|uniref:Nucleosome assembly protein n=1 Tax=Drechslerella stenobrocha 248 TaxID=1043628 RepID=W7HTG0_9PEZI|nr:hypothetical protein DRE_00379 [Drechslerella stenobrocha 248]